MSLLVKLLFPNFRNNSKKKTCLLTTSTSGVCTFLSFVWMHAPLAIRRCASVVAACNRAAALQNVYRELSCRAFLSSPPPRHSSFAPPDATISAHDLLPCAGITWGTKVVVQARNSLSLNSSMVRSQQLFSVFRSGFLFASSLRFLTRSLYLLKLVEQFCLLSVQLLANASPLIRFASPM